MSHGSWAIKPAEVTRVVKALLDAGLPVAGVRVHKEGGFDVVVGKPGEVLRLNVWDEVLPHEQQHEPN